MKKLFLILLASILLCACTSRDDYYVMEINEYSIAVGSDDVAFLDIAFDLKLPEKLEANQELKDIDLNTWNKRIGEVTISNDKKKEIDISKAILTSATFYAEELDHTVLKIDGIELSSSVKENCNFFNGEYVERNGCACVIEKEVGRKKNTILLYGNIYNLDLDQLDHIVISVK